MIYGIIVKAALLWRVEKVRNAATIRQADTKPGRSNIWQVQGARLAVHGLVARLAIVACDISEKACSIAKQRIDDEYERLRVENMQPSLFG